MATPTYDLLASSVLTSSATSVTFSSIDQGYRDLVLVTDIVADPAGSSSVVFPRLEFNADTGNNYTLVQMYGDESTFFSGTQTANYLDLASSSSTVKGLAIAQIMDYSATDKHKTVLIRNNQYSSLTAIAGRWANTSAITSLRVYSNFIGSRQFTTGSTFYLYGISA